MPIFNCDGCGREIADNEAAWTINVNKEIFDGEAVDVLDSACMFSFCEECAKKRDFERIDVPLKP